MKTLFIIDGSSCFYRAYHAIPHFANTAGLPTNAVYGFTQTIRKIVEDYEPDYAVVAFDSRGPTHRHEIYKDYKADRPAMPDDLSLQIPYLKEVVGGFNIAAYEKQGLEADDIIAALAVWGKERGLKVVIISSDKDLYQLVDETTVILDYNKDKEFGPAEVEQKFGVRPALIRDLLALAGDASDSVPGVPGIGPKTATKLLNNYGSFDAVFENIEEIKGNKLKQNLVEFKEQAILSKELVTLKLDVGLEFDGDHMLYEGPDREALGKLFKELEFFKLYNEMVADEGGSGDSSTASISKKLGPVEIPVEIIDNSEGLARMVKQLSGAAEIALYAVMEEVGYNAGLLGIAIATQDKNTFINLAPEVGEGGQVSLLLNASPKDELGEALALGALSEIIGKERTILVDDAKPYYLIFLRNGLSFRPPMLDLSLASYLLNPSATAHAVENVALSYLGHAIMRPKGKVTTLGKEELADFAASRARAVMEAGPVLIEKLAETELSGLLSEMELPLTGVLARMEALGIGLDRPFLMRLSLELSAEMERMENEIYADAGEPFNINSPKQLSELLFVKMGITPVKKTKTGFSTDESVLTILAKDHLLPQNILKYRKLAKLRSTYVEGLLKLVNPKTGRIHTSFNQTVTATGRLSSSRPNLQNLPVRDEYAGRIREAFVADKGFTFLSADYSQIELRLVAHFSEDPALIAAFTGGEDIHAQTAAEVFGLKAEEVTKEQRHRAKAINFGIIYGMGAYGLAGDLSISMKEAASYIDSYFAHYVKVRDFIERTVEGATTLGYTETLFGRRRFIPELRSMTEQTRRFGERMAVNTPIQGSAADMIKVAMLKIDERMRVEGFKSKMLLQVHDELVFECAVDEKERLGKMVVEEMERAVQLLVPVVVNLKSGPNLREVE